MCKDTLVLAYAAAVHKRPVGTQVLYMNLACLCDPYAAVFTTDISIRLSDNKATRHFSANSGGARRWTQHRLEALLKRHEPRCQTS